MILGQSNIVAQDFKGRKNQALKDQNQPPELFFKKKGVFKNFKKFTEKHLCSNLQLY